MNVIYVDVLFVINWVMDSMIFYSVTLMLNQVIKKRKILIAATMASLLYCMLVLCPFFQKLPYWLITLWLPTVPLLYLFKPKTGRVFIKVWLMSTAVAALYGGVIFNIWYMLGGGSIETTHLNWMTLFLLSLGVTILFNGSFYYLRRRLILPQFEYDIIMSYQGQTITGHALMDTGNLLYTSFYHEPVIVMTYAAIRQLLDEATRQEVEAFYACPPQALEVFLQEHHPSRLIPFESVGCKQGFLWGIPIDTLTIKKGKYEKVMTHCIVGISEGALFSDQSYDALLHPELIMEEDIA